MLASSTLKDWILVERLPEAESLAFHAGIASLSLTAALARRPRFHELIAPLMILAVAAGIGLLFARL